MTNVTPFMKIAARTPQAAAMAEHEPAPARPSDPGHARHRTFHFWRGASSRRYVHIVHNLLDCPEPGAANYILARVDACGERVPLRIARTVSAHGSENLAEIRYHAARLGASEVHLHLLGDTAHERAIIEWDLQACGFASLTREGDLIPTRKTVGA